MKALVTGATGFVGARLCRRLLDEGYELHVFTRSGSATWRIADILGDMVNHEVDLRDAQAVTKAVREIRAEVVCHLATYGGFARQQGTSAILESNFLGAANLLMACEQTGFACFVNTGSSSEYGVKTTPMTEDDLLEPLGDYGVAKAAATLFCRSEGVKKSLPVSTLRLFSPFGPWDDPKRAIPYLIDSLLAGEAPLLATPASVRDYIFVDDVLDCYLKVIERPPACGGIFNVGSGRQSSLGEIVELVRAIIGDCPEPVWGATKRPGTEPDMWVADIGKAERHLGWQPTTSLRTGLEKTVAWMREQSQWYRGQHF